MQRVVEPGITYDRCSSCGGLFLEAGALNALATGMDGDIEFCSLEAERGRSDVFPVRTCPRCSDRPMRKEELLAYSGVVFDHCERCHGWFLDRGELRAMSDELSAIRRSQGGRAVNRETHRGHVVTITGRTVITSTASGLAEAAATPVAWRQIDVYFREPLGMGLRVSRETWATRFLSLLGLHDVETGDPHFDRAFLVKADRGADVVELLTPRVQMILLGFVGALDRRQKFEILDDRVRFAFTAGGDAARSLTQEGVEGMIELLVNFAVMLDPPREPRS